MFLHNVHKQLSNVMKIWTTFTYKSTIDGLTPLYASLLRHRKSTLATHYSFLIHPSPLQPRLISHLAIMQAHSICYLFSVPYTWLFFFALKEWKICINIHFFPPIYSALLHLGAKNSILLHLTSIAHRTLNEFPKWGGK